MRLAPGISAEQARPELTALTRDAFSEAPFTITPIVTPLDLQIASDVRAPLGWLLAAVALADTGAYFTGRAFGRRKLAPAVSPGKTVEGAVGGAVAVLAWSVCAAALFDGAITRWLLLGVAVFAAAVVGDLFESTLKRVRGVKDSGGILPGHGGILDRIDSVLPAAPVFALLVT